MSQQIKNVDKNMSQNNINNRSNIKWYNPYETPFRLSGFEYFHCDKLYRRLPISTEELFEKVNPNLNILSWHTAGGQISFKTNSSKILIKATISAKHNMANMTAIGESGFDCYLGQNGERLKFYGVTNFDILSDSFECELVANLPISTRDILLHFPLYNGVKSIQIGLDVNAVVEPPIDFEQGKILFYGTSITQGGCASRPGMAYTNILSRWLNKEILNFGFSANGLGEYEMAELIADINNLSLIVLDYEANSGTNGRLESSLEGFIDIIRHKNPETPILVVSRIQHLADFYDKELFDRRVRLREFQKKIVQKRCLDGDTKIFFLNGNDLFDDNFDEYTVDFIHPTDLGLWKMAEGLFPIISHILKEAEDV